VLDGRGHARLAQNGAAHLLKGERAALDDLEHHRAHEERIGGKVYDAAATGAKTANQFIMLDRAKLHAGFSLPARYLLKMATVFIGKG
jgi:hypothetical protein